jgi:hypothetical protein
MSSIEQQLEDLIVEVYKGGVTVSSNLARSEAVVVAMAASAGLISTYIHAGAYGNEWKVTNVGLRFLKERELDGSDDE